MGFNSGFKGLTTVTEYIHVIVSSVTFCIYYCSLATP